MYEVGGPAGGFWIRNSEENDYFDSCQLSAMNYRIWVDIIA